MHIDSARELKSSLLKQYLKPIVVAPAKLGAVAVAARAAKQVVPSYLALRTIGARAVDKVDPIQRSISLGVARKGPNNFRLAIRIQTRALEMAPVVEAFVKHAKGEADVVYIGRIVKRQVPWTQQRLRPLEIGGSIGHFKITAGTLGCFVRKRSGSAVRILSNNHVLANENAAKKGDAIIQPGRYDGGLKGKDTVGSLDTFVRLLRNRTNQLRQKAKDAWERKQFAQVEAITAQILAVYPNDPEASASFSMRSRSSPPRLSRGCSRWILLVMWAYSFY